LPVLVNFLCLFGIKFLITDKEGDQGLIHDYPQTNLLLKLHKVRGNLDAKNKECEALRDQLELLQEGSKEKEDPKPTQAKIQEEINSVFGNIKDMLGKEMDVSGIIKKETEIKDEK